ncbi:STAS domain-containing protein [Bacillus kwashiorkori]|uniref:STAS domain-containing protein n=1 Tax=Bacillus kwashiorkori TaxID=1522318 RepID=UPI000780A3F6|nr:STAS domain-containing protein [Bacillus kwashiorkori]
MHRNKELYQYFLDESWRLTEQWYDRLNKNKSSGVYASNDPAVIEQVKKQNNEFHQKFAQVFEIDKEPFLKEFEEWIIMVAQDEEHTRTPLHEIIREFHQTQDQYIDFISEFFDLHKDKYPSEEIKLIFRTVIDTMNFVIEWFTEEYNKFSQKKLKAQQELILELSTPVIALSEEIALLPLIGEIDTARAKILLEKTLEQCSKLGVKELLLDLSGVVVIDTAVAHQLFQLIDALALIGVKTSLSGIRPEVAQTAIQLGLTFNNISIHSSLANSINLIKFNEK